jgi:hypothetical protein
MRAAIGLLLIVALIGAGTPPPGTIIHVGAGIRCQPDYNYVRGLRAPPITYSAVTVGKPGVPRLTPQELATLHRIEHFVKSPTLRFAWLDYASTPRHFVIYDASAGPCYAQTHAYSVLNGGCNEDYGPTDDPYETRPAPDCLRQTPYPWTTPSPRR